MIQEIRSAFIRAFMMTYRLTGHPCNDKWIDGADGKREEQADSKARMMVNLRNAVSRDLQRQIVRPTSVFLKDQILM